MSFSLVSVNQTATGFHQTGTEKMLKEDTVWFIVADD